MIKKYNAVTINDKKNAIKEVIQEIILCGLSRAGFFDKAVFYGGTALRIFYGLDRFSEDLDFSLKEKDETFNLSTYFPVLEKEIKALGLNMKIEEKEKTTESAIKSAFIKGDTKEHMLYSYSDQELIKIKLEVDTNPPSLATYEHKFSLRPIPYEINMYDIPSLFAGKIHAVLCRGWKNRVKGRDLYDYIFYIQHSAPINLAHLKERLVQSGVFNSSDDLTLDLLKQMLYERFEDIDYENAKQDVSTFIKDNKSLDLWSKEFFQSITNELK